MAVKRSMTVQHFLNYIIYSSTPPEGVNLPRWRGMLKWFDTRRELGEPLVYPRPPQ
jgi:hypothetical protein